MYPSFFKNLGPFNLGNISSIIDIISTNVKKDYQFNDFLGIAHSKENTLTFINDNEDIKKINSSKSVILCSKKKLNQLKNNHSYIVVDDVHYSVAKISNLFYRNYSSNEINDMAKPEIGTNCIISDNAVIENGTIIGDNVTINSGVIVKSNCTIGDNCYIDSNSVISNSIFAKNIKIGRNCSIGQSGFGFSISTNKNLKIFHIGRVVLQSGVNIGSNCSIDRGSFSDTTIGNNTFLDNLCHVAHNVTIGNNSIFAAMTGIAGSAKIGNNVMTGGQVGIAGHIYVGNNVRIAAKSGVFKSVADNKTIMGYPAINQYKFLKAYKKNYEQ